MHLLLCSTYIHVCSACEAKLGCDGLVLILKQEQLFAVHIPRYMPGLANVPRSTGC
jgi:hypothetical protein